MTLKRIAAGLVFAAMLCVVLPQTALAAGLVQVVPDNCNDIGGCKSVCDIATLAQNVLTDGIYIAVFLSAALFAWAGFLMLTSTANPHARAEAKGIFSNVGIGLVIILVSWLIVDTVMRTLTGASFGPWNAICMLFEQLPTLA